MQYEVKSESNPSEKARNHDLKATEIRQEKNCSGSHARGQLLKLSISVELQRVKDFTLEKETTLSISLHFVAE